MGRFRTALTQLMSFCADEVRAFLSQNKAEKLWTTIIYEHLSLDHLLADWVKYEAWRERLAQADKYWEDRPERLLTERSTCTQTPARMIPHERIVIRLYLREPK